MVLLLKLIKNPLVQKMNSLFCAVLILSHQVLAKVVVDTFTPEQTALLQNWAIAMVALTSILFLLFVTMIVVWAGLKWSRRRNEIHWKVAHGTEK